MFIPRFPTLPEKTLAAVNALGRRMSSRVSRSLRRPTASFWPVMP